MKKVFASLVILIIVFLIVSFFIPVRLDKKLMVNNTFANVVSSLFRPERWIHWDPSVSQAWRRDSSSCHFGNDTAHHLITIDIPGKEIRVIDLSASVYQLEEIQKSDTSVFSLAVMPFADNNLQGSPLHSYIVYAQSSILFYKMFPFMARPSFANSTVAALRSYLEDNRRFYGYPIGLEQAADTLFLTTKADIRTRDLFKTLPAMSKLLDRYARENNCRVSGKNLSYFPLPHDSITVMEGFNIDKTVPGNDSCNFRQLPSRQYLAVAHYEGRFRDKPSLYEAMGKFLFDHQLIKNGLPFEKYLSPLPTSDSSIVKLELSYPLRS